MIITKFGGTSVQDADAIARLRTIVVARRSARPLVVVSALAKVTDALLELGRLAASGDRSTLESRLGALVARHHEVAAAAGAEGARDAIDAEAGALERWLFARAGAPLDDAALDHLVSHGEIWSSRIVATSLAAHGVPSAWVDIRPVLRTDDRFTRATPDRAELAVRAPATFGPLLDKGEVPVTQGFLGATASGATTTLGRGGSDFTASLLGAAMGAERVEIWTDVNGLMTADPRLVPGADTLPLASYEESAELATFGAKVLHPATQLPLVEAGIPIVILNSRAPDHPGTVITSEGEAVRAGAIRSISFKKGVTVIHVRAPRMLGAFGFLRALFEVFERNEVVVDVLASSEVSVSCTIEDERALPRLLPELQRLGEVRADTGRGIIAVVGAGIRTTPGLAARIFTAVGPANIEMISQGASAINTTFVVHEADGPDTVRRLHREFFGR